MPIIKVKSVYMIKLPDGDWLNLALIRCVQVDVEASEVLLTWSANHRQVFAGSQARAIISALDEADLIDKSEVQ